MGDRSTISVNVPCEVVDEILAGNHVYLAKDGTLRWDLGGHVVAKSEGWTYDDH